VEFRLRRRDGHDRWILEAGIPRATPRGVFLGYIGSGIDITERREAEATQARLAAIVEASDDAIISKTLDGTIQSWNRGAERMYGYTAAEAVGRTVFELIVPPEGHERIHEFSRRLERGESVGPVDIDRVCKDGRRIMVSVTMSPIRDASGRVVQASVVAQDITERTRAEQALRESEQDYRLVTETASDAIVTIDDQSRILLANRAVEDVFGYTPQELLGQSLTLLMPEYLRHVHEHALERYRQTGVKHMQWQGIELPGRHKDGHEVAIEISFGESVRRGQHTFTGIIRNVTERQRVQAQLKASLREKDVLLKEIHHRVKNNLQIISSLLSLQADHIHDPSVLAMFRESQNRIRSMALIHEKLYSSSDFSRIDMGPYIQGLTEQLFRSYAVRGGISPVIDVRGVQLDIDLAIPCGLLINELVCNALEHAFPDGRTGQLFVGLTPDAGDSLRLVLEVRDTGVGLPSGVDVASTSSLGLRLVTALTEQLGGSMRLVREGGTAFRISFPARPLEKPPIHA
jgi:PAS domain S-box-containing protein